MEWFLVDDTNWQIDDGFVPHANVQRLINYAETNAWQKVSYGPVAEDEKFIPASRLQRHASAQKPKSR